MEVAAFHVPYRLYPLVAILRKDSMVVMGFNIHLNEEDDHLTCHHLNGCSDYHTCCSFEVVEHQHYSCFFVKHSSFLCSYLAVIFHSFLIKLFLILL